jgi:hypothetical protein
MNKDSIEVLRKIKEVNGYVNIKGENKDLKKM